MDTMGAGKGESGAGTAHRYTEINIGEIDKSPYQTRTRLDVEELAGSIREIGMMNPVTVRPRDGGGYELIAGHRRTAAAASIGWETVPAIVVDCGDRAAAEMCVTENMQREDLSLLEEAACVKALLDTDHTTQDVADRLGKSRQWVARRANLLNLCKEAWECVADAGHPLSVAPVEGLELLAALPDDVQERLIEDRLSDGCPTVAEMRDCIAGVMRELDGAAFDTGECAGCPRRTGNQPELFDTGGAGGLGQCLDDECWERRRGEAVRRTVTAILDADPNARVLTTSRDIAQCDSRATMYYCMPGTCHEGTKGAVKSHLIGEDGKAKEIWLKSANHTHAAATADEKPRQPDAEQKRMAAYCRDVEKKLSEEGFNPFADFAPGHILRVLLVTGTRFPNCYADAEAWLKVMDASPGDVPARLWETVRPVLLKRVKYMTIISCAPQHEEAKVINQFVLGDIIKG
jgi:ParB/RepB/Spo0J family partition protein